MNEQTMQQIERVLRKLTEKFPAELECLPLTDIYLQVKQESGELLLFDDDDTELTRCVVDEWIGNTEEDFYEDIQPVLRKAILNLKPAMESLGILKPYSFVLQGDERETLAELHLVDDETLIVDEDLMEGLSEDLDRFWEELSRQ